MIALAGPIYHVAEVGCDPRARGRCAHQCDMRRRGIHDGNVVHALDFATSQGRRSLTPMADKKTDAALREWRKREEKYADALAEVIDGAESTQVTKKVAIRISSLRASANDAMDTFLKRSLR